MGPVGFLARCLERWSCPFAGTPGCAAAALPGHTAAPRARHAGPPACSTRQRRTCQLGRAHAALQRHRLGLVTQVVQHQVVGHALVACGWSGAREEEARQRTRVGTPEGDTPLPRLAAAAAAAAAAARWMAPDENPQRAQAPTARLTLGAGQAVQRARGRPAALGAVEGAVAQVAAHGAAPVCGRRGGQAQRLMHRTARCCSGRGGCHLLWLGLPPCAANISNIFFLFQASPGLALTSSTCSPYRMYRQSPQNTPCGGQAGAVERSARAAMAQPRQAGAAGAARQAAAAGARGPLSARRRRCPVPAAAGHASKHPQAARPVRTVRDSQPEQEVRLPSVFWRHWWHVWPFSCVWGGVHGRVRLGALGHTGCCGCRALAPCRPLPSGCRGAAFWAHGRRRPREQGLARLVIDAVAVGIIAIHKQLPASPGKHGTGGLGLRTLPGARCEASGQWASVQAQLLVRGAPRPPTCSRRGSGRRATHHSCWQEPSASRCATP